MGYSFSENLIMVLGEKEYPVTINYNKPSKEFLGEWSGYGYVNYADVDLIKLMNSSTDTNIGTIIITNVNIGVDTHFEFQGSGKPKGLKFDLVEEK